MAHLGDDVAAYVDGQLSPESMATADTHLDACDRCRSAVRYQRLLKDRMRGHAPAVPSTLVDMLGALPTARPGRRTRVVRRAVGAVAVAFGASIAVLGTAYAVAPKSELGDPVTPQAEQLATITEAFGRPGEHLDERALDQLDRDGWPSRPRLGYDHVRLDARLHGGRDMVAQMYAARGDVFVLVEQVGALAVEALRSFVPHVVADRQIWVREGNPRVLTWDSDGMVYSLVTRLPDHALEHILVDLPAPEPEPTAFDRIGQGLVRMSSWVG